MAESRSALTGPSLALGRGVRRLAVVLVALAILADGGLTWAQRSAKPEPRARVARTVRKGLGKPLPRPSATPRPRLHRSLHNAAARPSSIAPRAQVARRARAARRGTGQGLRFNAGRIRRDVDLVIFDLDGTIAETRHDIAVNFDAGFRGIGVEVSMPRLIELVDGSPLHQTYWAVRPNGNEAELKRFIDSFLVSQRKRGPAGTPYRHIPELLKSLSRLPGVKLAVATARPANNAALLLEHMGLRDHFDLITGTSGTNMPHKPAPDMLLYVARRLGISPKRAVMVGDTHTDLMAARSAGMGTIAMTYGMGEPNKVREQNPDLIANDALELFRALGLDRRSGQARETARTLPPTVMRSPRILPVESSRHPGRPAR